ncbi:MAG TPA: hypothetical protein VN878_09435, partial [Usitatibacter sp.]|nr:hypothetical protein [Usitatibacter sp.]
RRYRQSEIIALVRSKPSHEQMVAGLNRVLIATESWRRPEFTHKLRERNQHLFELIGALSTTLEPAQRAHLQKRLRDYLRDITYLTALS